ncbi:MAG: co-chaperone DjlA [Gammaproteobacteria bacterium]|nr:co-chaperone DjlA [Gammaproteobacteria bacterium]
MSVLGLLGWNAPGDDLADGPYFSALDDKRTRTAFFASLFSVMGHIAKADGRVCEDEITAAEVIMERMSLSKAQKSKAIELFNYGKADNFPLEKILQRMKKDISRRSLYRQFMEAQLRVAYSDGDLQSFERKLLTNMQQFFDINKLEYEHLDRDIKNELLDPSHTSLYQAYATLGIKPNASDDAVKTVYRRLMSQHHPDRLQAENGDESDMRNAAEKAHQIKQAYEKIRQVRKL